MRKICLLVLVLMIVSCGCACTREFVRTAQYSQSRTWRGLEVAAYELSSPRFSTRIRLIPMFHIADPRFYKAVKREADAADLVLVEGYYAMGNAWTENERRRLAELLSPVWLAPQITDLLPGDNFRVVKGDAGALTETTGNCTSLLVSVENFLRRFHSENAGPGRSWDSSKPDWNPMKDSEERSRDLEREPRRELALTAKEAVESLAGNLDFVARRNNLLVDEVERVLAGGEGVSPPEKMVILYGAAYAPGILRLLEERLGYEPAGDPEWMNVWIYRENLKGRMLPYRANFKIEMKRDALLVRHRKELWQCYFSEARGGGVNVSAVYFQLRGGRWQRRQLTGPVEGESADRDIPVTFEGPAHFLYEKGSRFTPVVFGSLDTTRILFHARKNGKEVEIYIDPAELPDGTPLSAEYAVFPGGGVLPIPPQPGFLLGPEYRFSRRP